MEVYHVLPTNDLKPHTEECICPPIGLPYCECVCKPVAQEEGENLLIIHNSFDGRENFESDNKVRLN